MGYVAARIDLFMKARLLTPVHTTIASVPGFIGVMPVCGIWPGT
jgi:hypothetical protein